MHSLKFIETTPYSGQPETDRVSGWTYVRVSPIAKGAVRRTVNIGTLNIDMASDGTILGLEIENDPERRVEPVQLPHNWEHALPVRLMLQGEVPDSSIQQAYDGDLQVLSLYLGEERGSTRTLRLSEQVVALCTDKHIAALHILGVDL